MNGLPKNGNRTPIDGVGRDRHNCTAFVHTTVTVPPRVGCVFWSQPCRVIQTLLSNRKFYEELYNKRSRWRKEKNGPLQGCVLAPTLFNIYTDDQPIHDGSRSCITAQYQSFSKLEETIDEAPDNLIIYYKMNSLRANPEKNTIHCVSSQEQSLKVVWNEYFIIDIIL